MKKFESFKEFYPYYLSQHEHKHCKLMHVIGLGLGILFLLCFLLTCNIWNLILAIIFGYGLAWLEHVIFEKNNPTTFKYPLYSFMADFVMLWDVIKGGVYPGRRMGTDELNRILRGKFILRSFPGRNVFGNRRDEWMFFLGKHLTENLNFSGRGWKR